MKKVVLYKRLSAPLMERLRERVEVLLVEEPGRDGLARLRDALPEAHGLLGASLRLDAGLLDLAPRLEAIASVSVGVDNYDIDYLDRRGILLSNTPDVLTETTADTGFALILATARRVVELAGWVRAGEWKKSVGAAQFGTDVHGKTLGIVGMGRIGEALARRGHHGFGMRVLYHSHSPKPHVEERYAASYRPLDALLEESDFVCLTLPLTAATEGLIGAAQFARMRPQAIFINISRGRVVDEAALIEALAQRRIRAAGLDVFEREPLSPDSPLLRLPNVVATPHIGSATEETREAMARCAARQPAGRPRRRAAAEPGQSFGLGATARRLKAAPGRRPARRSASLAGIGLPESLLKRFFNVTHELIISLLIIIRKTKP